MAAATVAWSSSNRVQSSEKGYRNSTLTLSPRQAHHPGAESFQHQDNGQREALICLGSVTNLSRPPRPYRQR